MTDPAPATDPASELCQSCGLCCNGSLFDFGPLGATEVEGARNAGLNPRTEGEIGFPIPCARFEGICTVYSQRPATCRNFRCKVLDALDGNEIDFDEASRRVRNALDLIAEIERDADGKSLSALRLEMTDARADQFDPQLKLRMMAIHRMLDRYFKEIPRIEVMNPNPPSESGPPAA